MRKSLRDLSDSNKDMTEACVQPFKSTEIRQDFPRHSSFLIPNSSLGPKALCKGLPIPFIYETGRRETRRPAPV